MVYFENQISDLHTRRRRRRWTPDCRYIEARDCIFGKLYANRRKEIAINVAVRLAHQIHSIVSQIQRHDKLLENIAAWKAIKTGLGK